MAQYTVLSINAIEDIISNFEIGQVHSFKLLNGGSTNSNYLVHTDDGDFVITVCEQKNQAKAEELTQLLDYLAENGFSTSIVIRNKQQNTITLWEDKPIMLKRFIAGKIIENLPIHLITLIGKQIGKLHQISPPTQLPKQISYGQHRFHEVEQYAPDSTFNVWLKEKVTYLTPFLSLELPSAFIHSDIFCDNVIISEDETLVTIMDFEESTHYYRIFDIGMAIIGLCRLQETISLEKVESLLRGYQQTIPLLEQEQKALQAFTIYAGTAMTFWRHVNFNHTNPQPKLKDHYLGLKIFVDYLTELPENCFHKIFEKL